MKKPRKKTGKNKGKTYQKPVNLWPLTPDEALKIFLQVPPKNPSKKD